MSSPHAPGEQSESGIHFVSRNNHTYAFDGDTSVSGDSELLASDAAQLELSEPDSMNAWGLGVR